MILLLLLFLVVLWALGYLPITFFTVPNLILFQINGQNITLWNLLIFLLVVWIISLLPRPFREIASLLFFLWILSVLGLFVFAGLSNVFIVILIVGVLIFALTGI